MIKIKKGNHSLLVSKKTYETMFKPIGYIVEEEAPKKASSENKTEHDLNQAEDKNIEVLSKEEDNLTAEEEEKPVENDSHEDEGDKKDDKKEKNKKENGKENSLENILGMLSQKEEEKNKKK